MLSLLIQDPIVQSVLHRSGEDVRMFQILAERLLGFMGIAWTDQVVQELIQAYGEQEKRRPVAFRARFSALPALPPLRPVSSSPPLPYPRESPSLPARPAREQAPPRLSREIRRITAEILGFFPPGMDGIISTSDMGKTFCVENIRQGGVVRVVKTQNYARKELRYLKQFMEALSRLPQDQVQETKELGIFRVEYTDGRSPALLSLEQIKQGLVREVEQYSADLYMPQDPRMRERKQQFDQMDAEALEMEQRNLSEKLQEADSHGMKKEAARELVVLHGAQKTREAELQADWSDEEEAKVVEHRREGVALASQLDDASVAELLEQNEANWTRSYGGAEGQPWLEVLRKVDPEETRRKVWMLKFQEDEIVRASHGKGVKGMLEKQQDADNIRRKIVDAAKTRVDLTKDVVRQALSTAPPLSRVPSMWWHTRELACAAQDNCRQARLYCKPSAMADCPPNLDLEGAFMKLYGENYSSAMCNVTEAKACQESLGCAWNGERCVVSSASGARGGRALRSVQESRTLARRCLAELQTQAWTAEDLDNYVAVRGEQDMLPGTTTGKLVELNHGRGYDYTPQFMDKRESGIHGTLNDVFQYLRDLRKELENRKRSYVLKVILVEFMAMKAQSSVEEMEDMMKEDVSHVDEDTWSACILWLNEDRANPDLWLEHSWLRDGLASRYPATHVAVMDHKTSFRPQDPEAKIGQALRFLEEALPSLGNYSTGEEYVNVERLTQDWLHHRDQMVRGAFQHDQVIDITPPGYQRNIMVNVHNMIQELYSFYLEKFPNSNKYRNPLKVYTLGNVLGLYSIHDISASIQHEYGHDLWRDMQQNIQDTCAIFSMIRLAVGAPFGHIPDVECKEAALESLTKQIQTRVRQVLGGDTLQRVEALRDKIGL